MLNDIFKAVFGSRGGLALSTPALVVAPGQMIPVTARFEANEVPRDVAWMRLHLNLTAVTPVQGPNGIELQRHTRDVIPPVRLSERFLVPAGEVREFATQIAVPPGLPPSLPGQVEYSIYVVAPVAGQTIDTANHLPLTVVNAGGGMMVHGVMPGVPVPAPEMKPGMTPAPATAPVMVPGAVPVGASPVSAPHPAPPQPAAQPGVPQLPQGADVDALAPDGSWAAAMVVQQLGVMFFVQWRDGRPAMWVRNDQLRPKG